MGTGKRKKEVLPAGVEEKAKVVHKLRPEAKTQTGPEVDENFQHIVRIRDTDLKGGRKVIIALTGIKGIGYNLSRALLSVLNIDQDQRLGDLPPSEIKRIDTAIGDPIAAGVPPWMINRREDYDTGKDLHLTSTDLVFQKKVDIDNLGEIKSYRGVRHTRGLTVRGQRTKSSGRKGSSVGVQRRKDVKKGK